MAKLKTQIQLRRDTATNLANVVPIAGEPVYATDTKKFSIGDGSTKFSALKDYGFEPTIPDVSDFVTKSTAQTISGVKTFSTQQKFTVANGTSPFTVTSSTKVSNLNADMVDGFSFTTSGYQYQKYATLSFKRDELVNNNDYIYVKMTCSNKYLSQQLRFKVIPGYDNVAGSTEVTTYSRQQNAFYLDSVYYNGNKFIGIYQPSANTDVYYLKFDKFLGTYASSPNNGSITVYSQDSVLTLTLIESGHADYATISAYNYIAVPNNGIYTSYLWNTMNPKNNNTYDLGSSSYKWRNIHGVTIYENGVSLASKYLLQSDYVNTDTKVTQSSTTADSWRKVVLSKQSGAIGTAVTDQTDQVYVTPNIEVQPSTGTIAVKKLLITDTEMSNHIEFKRNNWNYIVASGGTSAAFGFVAGGKSASGANATLAIYGDYFIPGQRDNQVDMGNSSYHFKNFYLKGKIYNGSYNYTLPSKTGTIALTSDLPSLSDYVKGPASATDNAVARFDATTGKLIQNSGVTIDDSNNISTTGSLKLSNNGDVMWNSGSWWQRIKITDDSSANTNVFEFQQSSDSGANWTSLFTILDNGSVKAKKFVTDGSSNQYVVLGDGTTKALSDFAMDTDVPEVSDFVTGPSSSTDNALARYDGATGKIIQNSSATLDDSGNLKIAGSLYVPENKYAYFGTDQLASFRANQNGAFIVGAYGDIYFRGNLQTNDSSSSSSGVQLSKTYLKPEVTNTMDLGASDKIWKNIYAAKFVTNGSSNQYVVLGDGTTKALSDFAMDSEIPSLDNYVTLDGVQTISGKKTFSGGLAITSADQNTNMVYFLGIDAFANGGAVKWTNKSDIKLPYSQITGTPTIPTVNNGTLTIQRNGTTVATFTANQAGNTTANITDNDTLNTAGSTNDEAKLYLVGAKSQAASAQTFSDAQVYTEAGELNATSVCVAEHGQMKYDSTNQCIRFVIV